MVNHSIVIARLSATEWCKIQMNSGNFTYQLEEGSGISWQPHALLWHMDHGMSSGLTLASASNGALIPFRRVLFNFKPFKLTNQNLWCSGAVRQWSRPEKNLHPYFMQNTVTRAFLGFLAVEPSFPCCNDI